MVGSFGVINRPQTALAPSSSRGGTTLRARAVRLLDLGLCTSGIMFV